MLVDRRPVRPGWLRRVFRWSSDPKPGLDAPYLDQLLWVRREYLRAFKLSVAGLALLAGAVAIGTLGWIVFAFIFVVLSGSWAFTFARVSRRIAHARRETSEGYPTVAGR